MAAAPGCRRRSASAEHEEEADPATAEVTRPNPKEPNPYMKDNSAGSRLLASSVVGGGGASWRLKSLKRAKEQAAREGRRLEEVVEERWGSLGHLAASVSTSSRAAPSQAHLHATRGRKHGKVQWKKRRHNVSSEDQALVSSAVASINKFSDDGSFMDKINSLERKNADASTCTMDIDQKLPKESSANTPLGKLHMNQLAAKVLRLRMKGKREEAQHLSREMGALLESQDTAAEKPRHERERSSIRHTIEPSAADRRKREEYADLNFSMFKSVEDEYDFGDSPSKRYKRRNEEGHQDRNRSMLTQKERCLYCFENPSRPKHLVIAVGNFTYLMLPQFEPVVPGHYVILPLQHESATRTVDQDVWVEIRNFKKCLLQMFAQQDKDVVFMETLVSLAKQRRHCMIECIPVPCEVSNDAPMYFKKAIDEAEEEWSQDEMKKLITTSASRNLREAIPENFAYFHVEFGLDRGFAHVIDDESKFSVGFGLNVVRGMLRLPEDDMHRRRRRLGSVDRQKQGVASFVKDWEPFDWTKQLD